MEKTQKNKWFIIAAILVLMSVISINLYANYTDKEITVEDNIKLIGSVLAFSGVLLTVVFSSASTKQIEGVKIGIKEVDTKVDNKFNELKNDLSNVVIQITEKDLKDAEKFEWQYNGIKDIQESMDAKTEIHALGKNIKKKSKTIIEENPDIEENKKMFIIEVCNEISRIITTEYAYGLDDIDLVDFHTDLDNKVDVIVDIFNMKTCIKQTVTDNIVKYIQRLSGIQGISNGKRRSKFEEETMRFINLLVKSINRNKKTAA